MGKSDFFGNKLYGLNETECELTCRPFFRNFFSCVIFENNHVNAMESSFLNIDFLLGLAKTNEFRIVSDGGCFSLRCLWRESIVNDHI